MHPAPWLTAVCTYTTALVVIGVDQASKVWLPARSLNQGVSFGVAAGWGGLPIMTTILLLTLFIWLSLTAWRQHWPWWGWVAIGSVLGGGGSNVLDRFVLGAVRDPLSIPFTSLHNNVADYAIFLGVIVIFMVIYAQKKEDLHAT